MALYYRFRSLDLQILLQNQSFLSEKAAAQLVQLNQGRMARLMRQNICNGGSFKKTREQQKEAKYPQEMLAHVLAPETL